MGKKKNVFSHKKSKKESKEVKDSYFLQKNKKIMEIYIMENILKDAIKGYKRIFAVKEAKQMLGLYFDLLRAQSTDERKVIMVDLLNKSIKVTEAIKNDDELITQFSELYGAIGSAIPGEMVDEIETAVNSLINGDLDLGDIETKLQESVKRFTV